MRQEQASSHCTPKASLWLVLGQEVQKVEELQKECTSSAAAAAAMVSAHLVTVHLNQSLQYTGLHMHPPKSTNPLFSLISLGQILSQRMRDPMNNGGFKLLGAQKVCTEEAVHSAIVHALFEEKLEK